MERQIIEGIPHQPESVSAPRLPGWMVRSCAGALTVVSCLAPIGRGPAFSGLEIGDTAISSADILDLPTASFRPEQASGDLGILDKPSILDLSVFQIQKPATETTPDTRTSQTTEIIVVDDTKKSLKGLVSVLKKRQKADTNGYSRIKAKIVKISYAAKKALEKAVSPQNCIDFSQPPYTLGSDIVLDNMPNLGGNDDSNQIIALATDHRSCGGSFGATTSVEKPAKSGRIRRIMDLTFGNLSQKFRKFSSVFGGVTNHEVLHRYLGHAGTISGFDKRGMPYNLDNMSLSTLPLDGGTNINLNWMSSYDQYGRKRDTMGYAEVVGNTKSKTALNPVQKWMLGNIGKANPKGIEAFKLTADSPVHIEAGPPSDGIKFGLIDLAYANSLVNTSSTGYTSRMSAQQMAIVPICAKGKNGAWGVSGIEVYLVDPSNRTVASAGVLSDGIGTETTIADGERFEFSIFAGGTMVTVIVAKTGVYLKDITSPLDPNALPTPDASGNMK